MAKKVVIRKTKKRYVVKGVRHRLKSAALKDVSKRIGRTKKKGKNAKRHYKKHYRKRRTGQSTLMNWAPVRV